MTPQALGQLTSLVHRLSLFQRIDQIDCGEEADLLAMMFDGPYIQRGSDVYLASTTYEYQLSMKSPDAKSNPAKPF